MTKWTHKLGKSKRELGVVTPKNKDSLFMLLEKRRKFLEHIDRIPFLRRTHELEDLKLLDSRISAI